MEFIRIKKDNRIFYGGAQAWFNSNRNQSMGCGIIATANLIKNIEAKTTNKKLLEQSEFMELADKLSKRYIWVLPKFGINGWFLCIGINLYFIIHRIPYWARWGTSRSKIWTRIEEMLSEGLPVILSIGPNNIWNIKKKDINLYSKENGEFVCRTHTRAHYVSVTGIDDNYIKISSWGNKYYIHKEEYIDYCKRNSNFLFSNIMVIKKKNK